jgi:queuine/archaeosine tRNA-ribosyltransferase
MSLIHKIDTATGEEVIGKIKADELDAGIADAYYLHPQNNASNIWYVFHNLGKFPSITITDSNGFNIYGSVQNINDNYLIITFKGSISGNAFCN